jgi:hypothetical protein
MMMNCRTATRLLSEGQERRLRTGREIDLGLALRDVRGLQAIWPAHGCVAAAHANVRPGRWRSWPLGWHTQFNPT